MPDEFLEESDRNQTWLCFSGIKLLEEEVSMLPETKRRIINGAVNDALGGHKKLFGRYLLSGSDVMKIITVVLKVLGTLSSPECGQCTGELINDIVGNS